MIDKTLIVRKRVWGCFLLLLLILDLGYSYHQYASHSYIDGDFPLIVLGGEPYDQVLQDPLGIAALQGESYPGTNRFTSHAVMSFYFKTIPFVLQTALAPIDSLYTSIALTKLLIHIGLLFLLSYYVSSWKGFNASLFLLAAVLISPFFQAGPVYYEYMAIIDGSITYVMFYALPTFFLLVYFLPFYRYFRNRVISANPLFVGSWLLFTLFLVLFGPLPGPIILLFCITALGFLLVKNFFTTSDIDPLTRLIIAVKKINTTVLVLLVGSLIFSLYSTYLGTKNSENNWSPLTLEERYSKLIQGLNDAFLNFDSGFIFLFIMMIVQLLVLFIFYRKEQNLLFKLYFFLMLFATAYLFLLPMGGYRIYRPLVVKHDTLLPVSVLVLFLSATSGILLFNYFNKVGRFFYIISISALLGFYTYKDKPWSNTNECEKRTISKIARAVEDCVVLPRECTVGMWNLNTECNNSELAVTLFQYYNIFPRKIYYHFESEN